MGKSNRTDGDVGRDIDWRARHPPRSEMKWNSRDRIVGANVEQVTLV